MIRLNEETVRLIKDDKSLFIKLQTVLAVSEKTMYDYINKNSAKLTTIDSLVVIVNHTEKPLSELTNSGKLNKLLAK